MMRGAPWSDEDVALLTAHYPASPREELMAKLGRSWESIEHKGKRLGLKRQRFVGVQYAEPTPVIPADGSPDPQTMLKQLEAMGFQLVKRPQITDKVFDLDNGRFDGELVRIGIVSDTHLCSKHQQLTYLKAIYKRFADEGINIVLHAGDLLEGVRMYRGWELEVLFHGADDQVAYAVANYPKEKGITTYLISGNHDLSFMTNSGVNVVKRVCSQRDDMVYLGEYGAYLDLPLGLRAYLHHGAGGVPYARSYRLQKAVENFPPGNKPKLYCSGHYHVTATLPDYRNVFAMKPGCFQSQTEFLRRLGVAPDVGGWIMEYRVNPDTDRFDLTEISARWIPFRKEIANDY